MNCLAETKSQLDTTHLACEHVKHFNSVILAVTSHRQVLAIGTQEASTDSNQSQKKSFHERILDLKLAGYSSLKHYLNPLRGAADGHLSAKVARRIEPKEEDCFDSLSGGDLYNEKEIECWRLHRQCFAWSFNIGSLILLLGVTCLALGFLLPRQSGLVNHVELDPNIMTSSTLNNGQEKVLVLKVAVQHNNVLDTMKVCGGIAVCFGCLLLLMAFILPPGNHPLKWTGEEEQPNVNHINEALRNCGF